MQLRWIPLSALIMCGVACADANAASRRPADPSTQATQTDVRWLQTTHGRLKSVVFKSARRSRHPLIIIVLHGDIPEPSPGYQYEFAKEIADRTDDVIAAGVLRPAYSDPGGDRSDGEAFLGTGDNYTPEVVDAIAAVAEQLKVLYDGRAVILIGHSGGATIAANVLGRKPNSVNAAVLVGCGCDPVSWRKKMLLESKNPAWSAPIRSLYPLDLADQVSPIAKVEMLVGEKDEVALPEYTHAYYAVLRSRGVDVQEFVLPNLGHNILFSASVIEHVLNFVRAYGQQSVAGTTREVPAT